MGSGGFLGCFLGGSQAGLVGSEQRLLDAPDADIVEVHRVAVARLQGVDEEVLLGDPGQQRIQRLDGVAAGFSGGGLTAWEMARQLKEAGEEVSLLVLLDTPLPQRPPLSRADKAAIKWAELRAEGPGYLVAWAKTRWAWEMQKRHPKSDATGPAQFHNAAIEAAFRHAISVYDMPARVGATVLFRPPLDRKWQVTGGNWVSSAKEYVFSDNDLTRFAPGLQVIEVPGDHDSMVLEPNVRVMAAQLKVVIAEAEGQPTNIVRLAAE